MVHIEALEVIVGNFKRKKKTKNKKNFFFSNYKLEMYSIQFYIHNFQTLFTVRRIIARQQKMMAQWVGVVAWPHMPIFTTHQLILSKLSFLQATLIGLM